MRGVLISRLFWVLVVVACTAGSVALSLHFDEWDWFGRSGAVTTIAGAFLGIRRLLRLGPRRFFQAETTVDGGHAAPTSDEKEADRQLQIDISSMRIGAALLLFGTLVWAFGDLVGGSE